MLIMILNRDVKSKLKRSDVSGDHVARFTTNFSSEQTGDHYSPCMSLSVLAIVTVNCYAVAIRQALIDDAVIVVYHSNV